MMNKSVPNFKVWFYDYADNVISYDYKTKDYTMTHKPYNGINSFYLSSNLQNRELMEELTTEGYEVYLKEQCKKYANNLIDWRNEILSYDGLKITFDYFDNKLFKGEIYYRTHTRNIITFFKRLSKKNGVSVYKDFEHVYYKEYYWFSKCKNGGLMYLRDVGDYKDTYGMDFKMSYPTDMGDIKFEMPTKSGRETYEKELPRNAKDVKYGIYRVKICCDDENFKMVFVFNDNHYYTSYSLQFAMTYRKLCKITIELIQDDKPNAYLYYKKDLITGNYIFGNWCSILKQMRKNMPSNGLVKMLGSTGWGHLSALKTLTKTEEEYDEMIEQGVKISHKNFGLNDYGVIDMVNKETMIYTLIDLKKPVYDLPFRLLPFITSYSRAKMGKLIKKHNLYEKVIRIQTDSITFTENPNLDIEGFIYDEKISGDLTFEHVNKYYKTKNP